MATFEYKKKIGGKEYTWYMAVNYLAMANKIAKRLREEGYNARVVAIAGGYAVYRRKGK